MVASPEPNRALGSPGVMLVGRAVLRSRAQRPLAAAVSVATSLLSIAALVVIVNVTSAIDDAIRAAAQPPAIDADLVVSARSSAGLPRGIGERIAAELPGAQVIETIRMNVTAGDAEPLALYGIDPEALGSMADDGLDLDPQWVREPDALVLNDLAADRLGVQSGDRVRLALPSGPTTWRVAGTVRGLPGGAGPVGFSTFERVASVAGRDARPDAVLLGDVPRPLDQAIETVSRVVGDGASVGPPGEDVSDLGSFSVVRGLLLVVGGIALVVAAGVLAVAWRLALDDDRRAMSRLRLVGFRPLHLLVGQLAAMTPFVVTSLVAGVAAGSLASGATSSLGQQLAGLTGLATVVDSRPTVAAALVATAAALVILGVAWSLSWREALRSSPISALRPAAAAVEAPPSARPRIVAGCALVAVGALLSLAGALAGVAALVAVVVGAAVLASGVLSTTGGLLTGARQRVLFLAGRELQAHTRSFAIVAFGLSAASFLWVVLFGLTGSVEASISRNVTSWTRGELVVAAGEPGTSLRDERFTPQVLGDVTEVDGVRHIVGFGHQSAEVGGKVAQLFAYDTSDRDALTDLVDLPIVEGSTGNALWDGLAEGGIAVSSNLAARLQVDVGDRIGLPTSEGTERRRIVSVVEDTVTDGGIVYLDRTILTAMTGDDRVFEILVRTEPGADVEDVAARIEGVVDRWPSAVVWTGAQMRSHIIGLAGQMIQILRGVSAAIFAVALLIGVTLCSARLATWRRAVAVLRLGGMQARVIRRAYVCVGVAIGLVAGAAGLLAGQVGVRAGLSVISLQTGFEPPLHQGSLWWLSLPICVVGAVIAVDLASRSLVRTDLVRVLHED